MSRRSFGSRRLPSRRPRSLRPVVIVAPEGDTERLYAQALIESFGFTVRSTDTDNQFSKLFEMVNLAANQLASQDLTPVRVIVKDSESASDAELRKHAEHLAECDSQGVLLVVNTPFIERWLLQHFQVVSPYEEKSVITRRLQKAISDDNYGQYQKPWTVSQFKLLTQARLADARANCASQGHAPNPGFCMCRFVDALTNMRDS